MKKVTLISLIIFFAVSGYLFVASSFPNDDAKVGEGITATSKPLKTTQAKPVENALVNPPKIKKLIATVEKAGGNYFTMSDVASHNTASDCYLVINKKVYNVSSYIGYHPGGAQLIIDRCGREVTGIFAQIHSNRAWDLLAQFKVGRIGVPRIKSVSKQFIQQIADALQLANPTAEVVNVKPVKGSYIAKVILKDGKIIEVHFNQKGVIVRQEIANDEPNWAKWSTDTDDK